eukprot:TRINITY_DN31416_c0_g1_i1.p1 TRINITY_DN31416_c0_g1~~TRINITY_DN31416_c0_g1_i1.p1  ORF type:complete len:360 (+),score=59.28 TRINITY_DN31416_c0_g1_i1:117-1196(+)
MNCTIELGSSRSLVGPHSLIQLATQGGRLASQISTGHLWVLMAGELPPYEPLLQETMKSMLLEVASKDIGDASSSTLLLVSCLTICGSGLHGVAMAIRKYYGQGQKLYWMQWRWWVGVVCDLVAGCMIWPAMPFLTVELLVPMTMVTHIIVGYLLGLFFFKEQASAKRHMGAFCALLGIVGLATSSPIYAAQAHSRMSFSQWVQPSFAAAFACCLAGVLNTFLFDLPRSTSWALAAALCEALQFITSRTLASTIMKLNNGEDISIDEVHQTYVSVAIKVLVIVCILHFQQLGLEADLSRFVSIYLVATAFLTVVLGLAFFGDSVNFSPGFILSALSTLAGIWLLTFEPEPDTRKDALVD